MCKSFQHTWTRTRVVVDTLVHDVLDGGVLVALGACISAPAAAGALAQKQRTRPLELQASCLKRRSMRVLGVPPCDSRDASFELPGATVSANVG